MPRTFAADLMDDEPGLVGRTFRMLPARRSDILMALIAMAASGAIMVNALALQTGRSAHSGSSTESGVPLPIPAPAEARRVAPVPPSSPGQPAAAASVAAPPLPVAKPGASPASSAKPAAMPAVPAAPAAAPKPAAAVKPVTAAPSIGSLSAEVTGSIRPPADVTPSPRVLSVQKALAKLGYGPIRIDGRPGTGTREAIERFERDRRLPVSGEVSERLVRELTTVSGFTIE